MVLSFFSFFVCVALVVAAFVKCVSLIVVLFLLFGEARLHLFPRFLSELCVLEGAGELGGGMLLTYAFVDGLP